MDSKLRRCRSLPPLVEGKVYGYLKLSIDEIVWSKKNPGNVSVLASWWGENFNLRFKPRDVKSKTSLVQYETEALYMIKTNKSLFQEYIKNCETLELVITLENTNEVIGIARVFNLLDIFTQQLFSRYFPVMNINKVRVGDIHVVIQLLNLPSTIDSKKSITSNGSKLRKEKKMAKHYQEEVLSKTNYPLSKKGNNQCENIYTSILKDNDSKYNVENLLKRNNPELTDKLVAQVIARAQRLRGVMLKESQDDLLALSDNSLLDNINIGDEKKDRRLYDIILDKNSSRFDDPQDGALDTFKLTMSPSSLTNFTNRIVAKDATSNCHAPKNTQSSLTYTSENEQDKHIPLEHVQSKETSALRYVDSFRLIIETLSLTSAGYRRVRSSCVSPGDEKVMATITYFVYYNPTFINTSDLKSKLSKDKKIIKIFSRKQYDDVIHFNHKATYNMPKSCLRVCAPLKFKVYHRHLNQRSPTELGMGTMHVSDSTASKYLNTKQRVAIVNKGIKVGELKVTIELGCDGIHFGKEFIDAVMCEKENIPVIENSSPTSNQSARCRTATGTESKQNNAVSTRQPESVTSSNVTNSYNDKIKMTRQNKDEMVFKNHSMDNHFKDEILLHGLIYVSEGKDLPSTNTFMICRAFWREDRAASRVCLNTDKPFYNFHQLVPIIHGQEFLERTKDNYVIIEVYSKNITGDSLIGIAKLPVHQLYVAYRDPLVLPHLTVSKYPVISVDGWVNVVNLVSGQYHGQILALVAVGTADQIALLEMTRGLRNSCITPRTLQDCADVMSSDQTNRPNYMSHEEEELLLANQRHRIDKYPIEICRSQECQTEITTVEEVKAHEDCNISDEVPLHTVVDQLARVVHHCETHHDIDIHQNERPNVPLTEKMLKPLQLTSGRSNAPLSSDESSIDSPGDNLPSAMYRSVGVGAEFNEETATAPQYPAPQQQPSSLEHSDAEEVQDLGSGSFKATVEIECAYHLPMVEKAHESVEPSTYVTFQSAMDSANGRGSNVVTNVCLRTCTPKWDWKCSTRLSRDLVNNKDKRLILKIWRLYDPDKNVQVDQERDIVIGISAIDLSVFLVGFPVLCGWFNIINYTGEIIGQIRVSITPLENLTNMDNNHFKTSNSTTTYASSNSDENDTKHQNVNNDLDFMPQFDTESISFLSHSLKQKLTELNEITMRLRSRLHDVTENAFEDDFDTEFQQIESDGENDIDLNNKRKANALEKTRWSPVQDVPTSSNSDNGNHFNAASMSKFSLGLGDDANYMRNSNTSTYNNFHPPVPATKTYNPRLKIDYMGNDMHKSTSSSASTSNESYPVKGTKMHINHLLDKLSVQLGSHPKPSFPVQGNVMDLLDSLRYSSSHDSNSNPKRTNSIPTQTEDKVQEADDESALPKPAKISTIIREELVSEENNDSTEYDELSRHLITSNVRHMGNAESCTNPLFYDHLISDVSMAELEDQSPENEAVKQLDSRYVENFSLTVNSGLQRLWNLPELGKEDPREGKNPADLDGSSFRLTSSGVSENFDGNIDVNVVQKPSNGDLVERNESETDSSSVSLDKISVRSVREDDDNALTSSESSASIISRQAPDGGNPVEESPTTVVVNQDESNSS